MGNGAIRQKNNSENDFSSRETIVNVIDSAGYNSRGLSLDESKLAVVPKSNEIKALISEALKGKFMFATLKSSQLAKLIDVFKPVSCSKGEKIIEQGAVGDYM